MSAGGLRFRDWSLRGKIVALLVAASLVPLGVATLISLRNASADRHETAHQLLQARAQMLARRIDAGNEGYNRIAGLLARSSASALGAVTGNSPESRRIRDLVRTQLRFWTDVDPGIRAVALMDATGTLVVGTVAASEGRSLARYGFVQSALAGNASISDVFLANTGVDSPTIGYLAPIRADGGAVLGVAAIWVSAESLTQLLEEVNDQTGAGSFATLVDSLGIRVANSANPETVFHPIQPLAPDVVAQLVAEQRFGARTRELVSDVMGVSWEPALDFRAMPDAGMFRARVANGSEAWVVGYRCATVPWMVFHQVPVSVLDDAISAMVRSKVMLAAVIVLLALVCGLLFSMAILRPVRRLEAGASAFGAGALDTRVQVDSRDELGRLGAAFNDMAQRIQEQSAALQKESADQHRQLFQTMTEGFCTIEMVLDENCRPVDFIYVEANHEFESQSGLRDVTGRRKSEVVPDLSDKWMDIYGRVALTGEPIDIEEDEPTMGRHFHVRAYRVGGADSRRVAVLFNNITERRVAEQRRQAQLESLNLLHRITRAIGEREDLPSIYQIVLRSIEEQLPVDFACICRHEAEQSRLLVERIGARSLPIAQHMALHEGGHIDIDQNGLSHCVRGQLVYEPDVREVPYPFPRRVATSGLIAMVAAPLQVEDRVFGVLIAARRTGGFSSSDCEFLRQLSEHVALAAHHAQLYASVQQAYAELRDTQQAVMQQDRLRALGQMASGIAHDINNAISPVALYTDSLLERDHQFSEPVRTQLQVIQRAVHDVAATVSRMREFYREREPQLLLSPVQLNELVPHVVELTRARWGTMPQQRGITIEQRSVLQPDLPVIMGAESEIREALTNLVFNAVDAMPAGGTLTLRTTVTAAGMVAVEVCDTGIGMDEDARRRCLEPFFTTKGERGTGLGLAMVYGMVQRHSGDIEIDSVPGRGTCVRLAFGAATAPHREESPPALDVPRGLHILIIDDDVVLLRSLQEILQSEGHAVVAAGGGTKGIEAFRQAAGSAHPFSIVFTDLGMPQMDGRQVAQAIKSISPRTPVVMLTGWGERMVQDGDVPPDVDLMLGKPPKLRTLREALARFCAAGATP